MVQPALMIGEVARIFGLHTSALRFYERRGLLRPGRDDQGHRRFRDQDLRDLTFLLMCRDGGLELTEIAVLMGRASPVHGTWQDIVETRLDAVDAEITRLQAARAFLDQARRCSSDHPALDCPYAQQILERRIVEISSSQSATLGKASRALERQREARP